MLRLRVLFPALLVFFTFTSYTPAPADIDKNKVILDLIVQGLSTNHYKDIPIDDQFSIKVYDLYLKRLDYNKRFFLQSDMDALRMYRMQVDDQVKKGDYTFFDKAIGIFNKRFDQTEKYYKDILDKPMDFTVNETFETDPEKRSYPKNEKEMIDLWRKSLKYQVLVKIDEQLQRQEEATEKKDTSVKILSLAEIEKDAREKVRKSYDNFYTRMRKIDMDEQRSLYLNAITSTFDPHTNFFPPKDKENFDISMSGQLEGIGATLQEDNGYIKVTSIVPGSPSYKQGELKEGDYILKVAQATGEPVDIVDMPVDEAVKLIRGKKGTEVKLTIKKKDGIIKTISIIRDVVQLEETYAKSTILQKGENKVKVGYVHLPKFYADFSHQGGRNSGTDMAKEIAKLQQEGVDGIVIDLRNNGGGSLQDVVDMGGLFIGTGPIVQIKPRAGAPYVMEDRDPSVKWDGPLVIMINEYSASASEILAAAMQDYGRAVIIGSETSFGKGTVQRFFDLDDFVGSELEGIKPLGTVKLTTQKFYRIDGRTTQLRGVSSDVVLPDNYAYFESGEEEEDYPLEWDEINPVRYERWSNGKEIKEVSALSKNRVKTNAYFQKIDENAKRLKSLSDSTVQTLNLEQFHKRSNQLDAIAKQYDKLEKGDSTLAFTTPKDDLVIINSDTTRQQTNKKWHEDIRKDMYIGEAINVIQDLAKYPKHPVTNNAEKR
ncbi:MAG: carboxy terminal-processing peptidase [Chitinophagales bacterium]|nr:carboxy terminal-processing peptidase [Chitinophagales bacterium]